MKLLRPSWVAALSVSFLFSIESAFAAIPCPGVFAGDAASFHLFLDAAQRDGVRIGRHPGALEAWVLVSGVDGDETRNYTQLLQPRGDPEMRTALVESVTVSPRGVADRIAKIELQLFSETDVRIRRLDSDDGVITYRYNFLSGIVSCEREAAPLVPSQHPTVRMTVYDQGVNLLFDQLVGEQYLQELLSAESGRVQTCTSHLNRSLDINMESAETIALLTKERNSLEKVRAQYEKALKETEESRTQYKMVSRTLLTALNRDVLKIGVESRDSSTTQRLMKLVRLTRRNVNRQIKAVPN